MDIQFIQAPRADEADMLAFGLVSLTQAIEKEGCDYHFGRGIFARFAPWSLDKDIHYYDPPNFWHKPTNFRVCWYKWIGRDMKTNGVAADLPSIFDECVRSLQVHL